MGLDMRAVRQTYVKNWDHDPVETHYTVQVERGGKQVLDIKPERIAYIVEELICWRKANHIHGWFVNNVMRGEDPNDGRHYYVDPLKLRELRDVCNKVMKASKLVDGMVWMGSYWAPGVAKAEDRWSPGKVIENPKVAKKLLPTRAGCFFGCTDYDEDYYNDVVRTRDWAERTLVEEETVGSDGLYYSSSW